MKVCDFCHKDFEGIHVCFCGECNKKHPMCNKCYDEELLNGTIIQRHKYNDVDKLT